MNGKVDKNLATTMANVAVIGAIQSALLRTLIARKIVTAEMWDGLFAQALDALRVQASDQPHEGGAALDALIKVRDRERPNV